jgi:hypothetical protein
MQREKASGAEIILLDEEQTKLVVGGKRCCEALLLRTV